MIIFPFVIILNLRHILGLRLETKIGLVTSVKIKRHGLCPLSNEESSKVHEYVKTHISV